MASVERAPLLACMVGSACSALARVFGYPKEGNQKLTLFRFVFFFLVRVLTGFCECGFEVGTDRICGLTVS